MRKIIMLLAIFFVMINGCKKENLKNCEPVISVLKTLHSNSGNGWDEEVSIDVNIGDCSCYSGMFVAVYSLKGQMTMSSSHTTKNEYSKTNLYSGDSTRHVGVVKVTVMDCDSNTKLYFAE